MRRILLIIFALILGRPLFTLGGDEARGFSDEAAVQVFEGTVTLADPNRSLVVLQERGRAKALVLNPWPATVRMGERVAVEGRAESYCSAFPDFPGRPASRGWLGDLETPVGGASHSLARLRGWLRPPADGKYTFWLTADAEAELWLSPEAVPATAKKLCTVAEATQPGEWNRDSDQQSDPVSLKAGQAYYIEARQRAGSGPGFLAVAWRGPKFERQILGGDHLTPGLGDRGATNGLLREQWTNCFLTSLATLPSNATNPVMLALNQARVRSLGDGDLSGPRRIRMGRSWADDRNFSWVELSGTVSFVATERDGLTLELADGDARMTGRILHWDDRPAAALLQRRVRVQGVCEQTVNAKGEPVIGLLWMQDGGQLTLVDEAPASRKPVRVAEPAELPGGGQESLIAELPADATERGLYDSDRFRIRGVVTFRDCVSGRDFLFVQDESGGAQLRAPRPLLEAPPLAAGQRIEADGEIQFAPGAPPFGVTAATILGWGQWPKPVPFPDRVAVKKADGQWVEAQGVVRAVKHETLFLMEKSGLLPVWVGGPGASNALAACVDALVTVRGVLTLQLSNGPTLLVPSASFLQVHEPAPPDPFRRAPQLLDQVRAEETSPQYAHRVKLVGVVTYRDGRMLCVQDETGGTRVMAVAPGAIAVGDRVEAVGFPDHSGASFTLVETVLRTNSPGWSPAPATLPLDELLTSRRDAILVQVEGVVLDQKTRNDYHLLELQNGPRVFAAVLAAPAGELPVLPVGSRIRVTGVNRLQFASPEPASAGDGLQPIPATMDVLLRRPADVVLLQRPPWWNWRYTLAVVAALAVILIGSLVWIGSLRRRVEERTRALKETMGRLQKETEVSATLAERDRLAAEIHDTLEQGLSGILMQLDGLDSRLKHDPEGARGFLEMARRMVSFSRGEVRHSLWNLESSLLANGNLGAALTEIAKQMGAGNTVTVNVELSGPPQPLPAAVEHHLLRCAQEALNNALKHAQATVVQIRLAYGGNSVQLAVADNGRGFDPDAVLTEAGKSLGLRNLRSRSRKIKAQLEVISSPGGGTTIRLTVPLPVGAGKANKPNV